MSPTTSPMRVAALPSSVMVWTVRRASLTARPATSVERVACSAISPIEAASSSRHPAPLLGGAGLGGDLVGGAVELRGGDFQALGGLAHLGEHLVDRHLEPAD